ncbi:MAG: single-stranded DNA-binding protein, partial [Pseudomonadota bacterium]|nr:single-stranded DNA-binding protein [Pseudomonadota bacterium]
SVATADGEELRDLAVLRVRFNRPALVDGKWEDRGGFWANVEVWGERAKSLDCIRKGAIVGVAGNLVMDRWQDKETGETKSALVVKARSVTIVPSCIESVTFKTRAEDNSADAGAG